MDFPSAIVIDLDGTLVHSRGHVSDANKAALQAARDAGVAVLVATGRTWSECRGMLDAAGIQGDVITAGGSRLTRHPGDDTLHRVPLDGNVAARAAACLSAQGLGVLVLRDPAGHGMVYHHLGPTPLHPVSTWWHAMHDHTVYAVPDAEAIAAMDDVLRIAAVAPGVAFAGPLEAVQATLGEAARVWHWEAVTDAALGHQPVHLMEIFNPQANKWGMVVHWCARNGVDPAHVVAIGDGLNDVELIRSAPLGVAMANADARVLAVADYVTCHHDDDGVADVIHALLQRRLDAVQ